VWRGGSLEARRCHDGGVQREGLGGLRRRPTRPRRCLHGVELDGQEVKEGGFYSRIA
jgi:hypothetical protein